MELSAGYVGKNPMGVPDCEKGEDDVPGRGNGDQNEPEILISTNYHFSVNHH